MRRRARPGAMRLRRPSRHRSDGREGEARRSRMQRRSIGVARENVLRLLARGRAVRSGIADEPLAAWPTRRRSRARWRREESTGGSRVPFHSTDRESQGSFAHRGSDRQSRPPSRRSALRTPAQAWGAIQPRRFSPGALTASAIAPTTGPPRLGGPRVRRYPRTISFHRWIVGGGRCRRRPSRAKVAENDGAGCLRTRYQRRRDACKDHRHRHDAETPNRGPRQG